MDSSTFANDRKMKPYPGCRLTGKMDIGARVPAAPQVSRFTMPQSWPTQNPSTGVFAGLDQFHRDPGFFHNPVEGEYIKSFPQQNMADAESKTASIIWHTGLGMAVLLFFLKLSA